MQRKLIELFTNKFNKKVTEITELKTHSSNRKLFRIKAGKTVCIGSYNSNIKENKAFINFAGTFRKLNLNVPEIYSVSKNFSSYILEDLGDITLFEFIKVHKNDKGKITEYYEKVLKDLTEFQIKGKEKINFNYCYQTRIFDKKQIRTDLKIFEDYFLKGKTKNRYLKIYKHSLTDYFINTIEREKVLYFMYRDFQPRNIMVRNNDTYYIDFQSGRKGPLQYDLASFLFSGSILIDDDTRDYLMNYYLNLISGVINIRLFMDNFYPIAIIRVIQMLGSYSYNYELKGKNLFITKIENAMKNLKKISVKIDDENVKLFLKELNDAYEAGVIHISKHQ